MLETAATFERAPFVAVSADSSQCISGWQDIAAHIRSRIPSGRFVLCVECYPGVLTDEIATILQESLGPSLLLRSEEAYRSPEQLERQFSGVLTDDPVFGRMNGARLSDFFHPDLLQQARDRLARARGGLAIIAGTGATGLAERWDMLVYADMARWEIQQRQRQGLSGNLGAENCADPPTSKYKRAFFLDWRVADRLKTGLLDQIDYLLDTNDRQDPKMISGEAFRGGLEACVRRPFSVVPLFDPGPWGGQWMRKRFGLPDGPANYAWCFNCVPEENSLLLGFGRYRVEVPALDVVLRHPRGLLGDAVFERFGAEFPIRFDFLDTMDGGNLSLQVHPLATYIREHFGMPYTQDESYYLLDAASDAVVYLGLRDGVDQRNMRADLERAQNGGAPFPAEDYVNAWPARKHDHFSIPAGTIHCSGRNSVVLEVSATPYIFTFKLWDWGRLGLDGEPRPIHLHHGIRNIQWDRTTGWVRRELIGQVGPLASGPGWSEERTGLHESEFIETRRHWFTRPVPHDTHGTVNVLNLVEGDEAIVESPSGAFEPFPVHHAETFIVPAAVGPYVLRPARNSPAALATLKAFVRS
jgi:mannose-6-phosphate isomerase class I